MTDQVADISFREEYFLPDSDIPLIVELTDKTVPRVKTFYNALTVSRELLDGTQIDMAHPYVLLLQKALKYDQETAIRAAYFQNKQYLEQTMDDAFVLAMTYPNFTTDVSYPGIVKPSIETELPDHWWVHAGDDAEGERLQYGQLPLPPTNENNPAERRLAFVKVWQGRNDKFRSAVLDGLKRAVVREALASLPGGITTDEAGFHPRNVGGNVDAGTEPDRPAGESQDTNPSAIRGSDAVPRRKSQGKRQEAEERS